MKIIYDDLQIENTRRCDAKCKHCCRGDAEDLDLTEEIIDAFFEKNDIQTIGRLMFSGGEPSLNGKLIEYIVDRIIEKKISVYMFMLAINGLNYSQDLVNGLNKLRDYILSTSERHVYVPGLLLVSQDQYHKPADPKVIEQYQGLSYFPKIDKSYIKQEDLLPYGRAFTNKLSKQKQNLKDLTDYQRKYKVKEDNGESYLIIEYQYLAANGNVINDGCQSYDLMDKYALGNVRKETIQEMYLGNKTRILK